MALTTRYCNLGLATGSDNGTTEANAWQSLTSMAAGYAADDLVNIKNTSGSRWQEGAAVTLATSATALAPIYLRGYTTTPGDGGLVDLDMEANDFNATGEFLFTEGLDIIGSQTNDEIMNIADGNHLHRCKIVNNNTGAGSRPVRFIDASISNCYLETKGTSSSAYALWASRGSIYGCHFKSTLRGINLDVGFANISVNNCIIEGSGGSVEIGINLNGLNSPQGCIIANNTIWNFTNGIYLEEIPDIADTVRPSIYNNVIYNVTNGMNNAQTGVTDATVSIINNFIGGATSNRYLGFGDLPLPGDVILTADPFTTASSGDFSLNDTAGGGALVKASAMPTKFDPTGSVNNYLDGGGMQHEESAGGGDKYPYPGARRY